MGKEYPCNGKNLSTNFPGSPHTMDFAGLSQEPISQAFPILWVFLSFLMLWEIDEKNRAFPISGSIPQDGNLMKKLTYFMEKVWQPISQAFPIQ